MPENELPFLTVPFVNYLKYYFLIWMFGLLSAD